MNQINLIQKIDFFTPTSKLKELVILEYIENNPNTTQKELAEIVNSAPSMINVYINDYEEQGYIIREYISSKIINYKITPKGIQRKNYLLINYLNELLKLYQLARENIENFLQDLEHKGYKNILLYGAGEVAETILSVIRDRETLKLNIIALIDDDQGKQGKKLLGNKVIIPNEIKNYEHDAVIITSYTFENDIRKRLEELEYPENRVIRFFSR